MGIRWLGVPPPAPCCAAPHSASVDLPREVRVSRRRFVCHLTMAAINASLLVWILAGEPVGSAEQPGANRTPPPFRLADVEGKLHDLTALKGKVALIDFWAMWCDPCKNELPELDRMAEEFAEGGFEVVAITVDEEIDAAKRFIEERGIDSVLVLHDPESEISEKYGVVDFPTSFLLDRDQRIIKVFKGSPDMKEMHFDIMEAVVR